jgi:ferredoxin
MIRGIQNMELFQISKNDFKAFVHSLIGGTRRIVGVVEKDKRFVYDVLEDEDKLVLDYDETLLPPKVFLQPPKETLLTFKPKDSRSYKEVRDARPQVIIGVHPGDCAAIALLDRAFSEGSLDGNYISRRANTIIIGMYPTAPHPKKHRFTSSMIRDEAYKAADCMLIDCGNDTYAIEVISPQGKQALKGSAAKPASPQIAQKAEDMKKAMVDETSLPMDRDDIPAFLSGKEHHPIWEELAKKCFSCGSCVLVCPTCYCFDVQDEVDLSLTEGQRVRVWDGCTLKNFAVVADGHNFRKSVADRIRHRIYRKQKFLLERFGLPGCVGCGRCKSACVPDIAFPVDILTAMKEKEA